jgi:DNA-binding NarL/FixJ family response regulator
MRDEQVFCGVVVAADHPVVRRISPRSSAVVADMTYGGGSGRQASIGLDLFNAQPDVTLMDLRMPVLDGVNAIKQSRQHVPNACIIVLTTYDHDG